MYTAVDNYKQQFSTLRQLANHPHQALSKLVAQVRRQKIFSEFFRKYSAIAQLLPSPSYLDQVVDLGASTLQTRNMVLQNISDRVGNTAGIGRLLQQSSGTFNQQLTQVKQLLDQHSSKAMPEDFQSARPSIPKTKTFFQKLQLGFNAQNAKDNRLVPATTDFALSLGYELGKKTVIGIGSSYKVGWGEGLRHLSVSSQGISLRSFVDYKLKGIIYGSGGYEYNYQPIPGVSELPGMSSWNKSGLVGLSVLSPFKKVKYIAATKVMVLWDFLAKKQLPQTTPFKVRFGYNLKK
jgi:hypothetical protein